MLLSIIVGYLAGSVVQAWIRLTRSGLWGWHLAPTVRFDGGLNTYERTGVGVDGDGLILNVQMVDAGSLAVHSLVDTFVDVNHLDLDP